MIILRLEIDHLVQVPGFVVRGGDCPRLSMIREGDQGKGQSLRE